jgi:predicted nucleic acid-binding Zn ribbon protein
VAGRVTKTDLLGIAEISAIWPEVVGERLAAEAQPSTLKDGRLVVSVPSSVWAGQVRLMTAEILERLKSAATSPVTEIEVRVRR